MQLLSHIMAAIRAAWQVPLYSVKQVHRPIQYVITGIRVNPQDGSRWVFLRDLEGENTMEITAPDASSLQLGEQVYMSLVTVESQQDRTARLLKAQSGPGVVELDSFGQEVQR